MQHILVIDDDSSVRSFLKRGLSYEGYAVEVAEHGEQGLAQAREKYPDLVILDWMMPGLDGLEVLRRLRLGRVSGILCTHSIGQAIAKDSSKPV